GFGGFLERGTSVADEGGDIVADDAANEVFAVAGGGNGASGVVSKGSGADDWGIADTAEFFVSHSAGGSGGGEISIFVQSDGSDGSEHFFGRRGVGGTFLAGFHFAIAGALPLFDSAFGAEIFVVDEFQFLFARENLGAFADQENVRRFLHDFAGERNRISDVFYGGDGAGILVAAVHDGGVEFSGSFIGEDGTATGVEKGRIFENADGGF